MSYHQKKLVTNASLISMLQRFSDIFIMFLTLYLVCSYNHVEFAPSNWILVLIVLAIFQMIGGITDFYRSWRGNSLTAELKVLLQNWSLSIIITSGIVSLMNLPNYHLRFYFEWYILACIGLTLSRALLRKTIGAFRKRGYNTRKVAIVGHQPVGLTLAQSFIEAPWLGFSITGLYGEPLPESLESNIPYVGDINLLVEDAKSGKIDRVYIAMPMIQEHEIKLLLDKLSDTTCSVMYIPDIFTYSIIVSRPEEINGIPVVSVFDTPMNGVNMVLKRVEDIILSSLILVFISPILILIGFCVKVTSPGPAIFRQIRYGIDGKPIKVWKFRSMKVMENGSEVIQATKGDARLTTIGGFLRRTSLDELPQFVNVFLGDMSIVGPRPHAVAHNEQYRGLIKGYMLRHKVKPGITGWAQINGWRGETDTLEKMQKRIEFDLEYIREWSIWFDLKIVFFTIFKGFISKTAY